MTDKLDINIDKLILEIKKRPAIYNYELPEYKDRNVKNHLWSQVCENVVPHWNQLGSRDKFTHGRQVQREWKMMLTSFQRDLFRHARDKLVRGKRTPLRKYLFLNKMKFLLSTSTLESLEKFIDVSCSNRSISRELSNDCVKCNCKYSLTERRTYINEGDDDKAFLLSLLPALKQLSPDQKFAVRISIMNTISQVHERSLDVKLAESMSFVKSKSPDNISLYSLSHSSAKCIDLSNHEKGDFQIIE